MNGSETYGPASLFGLDGRVAVVTGGSSGLGEAVGRCLAAAGASVAVLARRRDRLEVVASEIGGLAVACDLLDHADLERGVALAADTLGPPQILVNVAGAITGVHRAEEEAYDSLQRTLSLNLVAPYLLCQQVFPHMRATGRGAIVNVSSISGLVGIPGIPQGSYAASKAGLSGMTTELAVQWGRHRIRVNTVAAGFFRSDMTVAMYEDERTASWLKRNTLLPDEPGVSDLVGAVLWLVSDAGRYVTGQTIAVDGGWTAH